jgi:hypothetical protein
MSAESGKFWLSFIVTRLAESPPFAGVPTWRSVLSSHTSRHKITPSDADVTVEWLALQLHILEVLGLKLGPEKAVVIYSNLQVKRWDSTLN